MIKKNELTGSAVKKGLKANRSMYRWHNKNKSGGNFGINIYFAEEFNRDTDKELTGYYNSDGVVYSLSFGNLYSAGHKVPIWAIESLETLFSYCKQVIAWEKGNGESPEIRESELLPKEEQFKIIGVSR